MKITLPVLIYALIIGLVASAGFWIWSLTHDFRMIKSWWEVIPWATWHAFDEESGLKNLALWSLGKGFVPVLGVLFLLDTLADKTGDQLIGGAYVVAGKVLARQTLAKNGYQQIMIAGIPMPEICEPNHLLLVGSTNTGKSTAMDELLVSALNRSDRCIVIDPNGHSLSLFGKKGDIVLNPFDQRSPGWSPFNEIDKPYDYDRIAKSIIPDTTDAGSQVAWLRPATGLCHDVYDGPGR